MNIFKVNNANDDITKRSLRDLHEECVSFNNDVEPNQLRMISLLVRLYQLGHIDISCVMDVLDADQLVAFICCMLAAIHEWLQIVFLQLKTCKIKVTCTRFVPVFPRTNYFRCVQINSTALVQSRLVTDWLEHREYFLFLQILILINLGF